VALTLWCAAQLHQAMKAQEELLALKVARGRQSQRDQQRSLATGDTQACQPAERSACLMAVCSVGAAPDVPDSHVLPRRDVCSEAGPASGSAAEGSASSWHDGRCTSAGAGAEARGPADARVSCKAVVGSLDLHAVRALPGEVLIGAFRRAACVLARPASPAQPCTSTPSCAVPRRCITLVGLVSPSSPAMRACLWGHCAGSMKRRQHFLGRGTALLLK